MPIRRDRRVVHPHFANDPLWLAAASRNDVKGWRGAIAAGVQDALRIDPANRLSGPEPALRARAGNTEILSEAGCHEVRVANSVDGKDRDRRRPHTPYGRERAPVRR